MSIFFSLYDCWLRQLSMAIEGVKQSNDGPHYTVR